MQLNSNNILRVLTKAFFIGALLVMSQPEVTNAQGVFPSLGGSRSGTSGFQFLKINVDARSSALGGSNVADAMDGSALL
ncbi:MAG TPA: hypothetical protein DD671_08440, partial [Balneolaceae bacterium]|nr:hypothetical protein [Balneolaceae bacterium]